MVYGIDLGTTNSLIGTGDRLYTGLVPSDVDIKRGEQVSRDAVGESVVNAYKVDMSMSVAGELAVDCSTVILKTLADKVKRRTGEEVSDVVISVPASFTTTQREAVHKAGKQAGLSVDYLINEPTAAALYVCRELKDLVVVYDLGGGTFDVSIVDSRTGVYTVVATDGDLIGGNDLDAVIMQEIFKDMKVPIRNRKKQCKQELLIKVSKAKERLQKTGESISVDCSMLGCDADYMLTIEKYKEMVEIVFGGTIRTTINLVSAHIPSVESPKIVFVGGSTSCPYLKELVLEATGLAEVVCKDKPDLIVAKGVALYAQELSEGRGNIVLEDVTKSLCIESQIGKAIPIIEGNTIVPCSEKQLVYNTDDTSELSIRLFQGNAMFCKDNTYIGTLVYEYAQPVKAKEGTVELEVIVERDGVITLRAKELLYIEAEAQEVKLVAR